MTKWERQTTFELVKHEHRRILMLTACVADDRIRKSDIPWLISRSQQALTHGVTLSRIIDHELSYHEDCAADEYTIEQEALRRLSAVSQYSKASVSPYT